MIQDNNIESLEEAAKKYAKHSYEVMDEDILGLRNKPVSFIKESILDWTELDFMAGANWQAEQYKDLIQSHADLLNALTKLIFVVECNRATNGVSLEIMYQTEYWLSKSAIEKANSIINQQK